MTDPFVQAKRIVSKLVRAGYLAYFAGGWVRDYVMGHPSADIDIATDASPADIMNLFPQTLIVGLSFGIVIVVMEGHQFEVATFRKDLPYLDGRHPQGIELSTPREDALRRDFTINGMFYDPLEGVLHDYVQGQQDIARRVIRTIGLPYERFFEDRLRMLRAFRFSSRFGFNIDIETQEAIREHADKLFPAVAMERVWQEFNKMVAYPGFDQAIVEMHRLGLLDVIFPEIEHVHLNELRRYVKAYRHFPSNCPTIFYLMELFPFLNLEQKIEIAKRLKVSKRESKRIEFAALLEKEMEDEQRTNRPNLHQWATLLAHPDCQLALSIMTARHPDAQREQLLHLYAQRFLQLERHIERLKTGKPVVSATLLHDQGIQPGREMGLLLKEAERLAIVEDWDDPSSILSQLATLPCWKGKR